MKQGTHLTDTEKVLINRRYEAGESIALLAAEYNTIPARITDTIMRFREYVVRDTKAGKNDIKTLTPEQFDNLREDCLDGLDIYTLAKKYNLGLSNVLDAIENFCYKDKTFLAHEKEIRKDYFSGMPAWDLEEKYNISSISHYLTILDAEALYEDFKSGYALDDLLDMYKFDKETMKQLIVDKVMKE